MIKQISNYSLNDQSILGGKAYSLLLLDQNKFIIPKTFVVDSDIFSSILETISFAKRCEEILSLNVDLYDHVTLTEISRNICNIIDEIKLEIDIDILDDDLLYAVRSSASCEDSTKFSCAGRFKSYLGIHKANVAKYIVEVWKSMYSVSALSYLYKNKIEISSLSMAVVVQEQINSEISGVAFSKNPVDNNSEQVVVEVVYGLGESLVSGEVTPDTYIYNISTKKLDFENISDQKTQLIIENGILEQRAGNSIRKLSNEKLEEIVTKLLELKSIYKTDVDIEWAYVDEKLYMLQCRPITTI